MDDKYGEQNSGITVHQRMRFVALPLRISM